MMKNFREVSAKEMASVEGGTWIEFLNNFLQAVSAGCAGYGQNGVYQDFYHSVDKNKYAPGGP